MCRTVEFLIEEHDDKNKKNDCDVLLSIVLEVTKLGKPTQLTEI